MILTIAGRELRSLILSPLAWALLAVVQGVTAWLFMVQIDLFMQLQPRLNVISDTPGVTDLIVAPLLGKAALVVLLTLPILSMRLLSEEFRAGTFSLLLSAPVSMTQITLGKYLALLGFLGILLLLVTLMPLSLLAGGGLDLGKLAAALLGTALVVAGLAAVGLYLSSLTSRPAVAAVTTYGVSLFLWIAHNTGSVGEQGSGLFSWLSLTYHYQFLLKGLVRSSDLIYFALLVGLPLILTIQRLDSRRLGQ